MYNSKMYILKLTKIKQLQVLQTILEKKHCRAQVENDHIKPKCTDYNCETYSINFIKISQLQSIQIEEILIPHGCKCRT